MRDINKDGDVNSRDYYDDLGGAYYFKPGNWSNEPMTLSDRLCIGILGIVVGIICIYLAWRL